jgi:hypothetical protein
MIARRNAMAQQQARIQALPLPRLGAYQERSPHGALS